MLPFRGGAGRIRGEVNIEKEAIVIAAEGSKSTRGIPQPTGTCHSSSKRRQFQNEGLINCERMFCLKLYMVQDIESFLENHITSVLKSLSYICLDTVSI
jgi:hypothetical protein